MEMSLATTDGSRLEAVERLAIEAGAAHLATDVRALSDRVRDGLFYMACVGQFKRGKSTLLNALMGEPVLPVGVVPVTAVVTVVRHGERRSARVRFAAGGWQEIATGDLAQFVTEEQNPENGKGVDRARHLYNQGSQAVRAELERINTLSDRLMALGLERKGAKP